MFFFFVRKLWLHLILLRDLCWNNVCLKLKRQLKLKPETASFHSFNCNRNSKCEFKLQNTAILFHFVIPSQMFDKTFNWQPSEQEYRILLCCVVGLNAGPKKINFDEQHSKWFIEYVLFSRIRIFRAYAINSSNELHCVLHNIPIHKIFWAEVKLCENLIF